MEQKQFSPTDSHFEHSSFQHSPSTPAASLSLQPIAYIFQKNLAFHAKAV